MIKIDNIAYYKLTDLKNKYSSISAGFRSAKHFIRKKSIPNSEWLFIKKDGRANGVWKKADEKSARPLLAISVQWAKTNIPELMSVNEIDSPPDIILLKPNEKMRDVDGNIIDIEMRGERTRKKCYFSMKDLSVAFNIPNLKQTLKNPHGSYTESIDYVTFHLQNENNVSKEQIFVTYMGLLRILFTTRNNKTNQFIDWASDVLFVHQFGNSNSKQNLASELLGTHPTNVRKVLDCHAVSTPCIYLLQIGKVSDVRSGLGINSTYSDTDIVYKIGKCNDLSRRISEHHSKYKKYGGEIKLEYFYWIDPYYTYDAEKAFKDAIRGTNYWLPHEKYKELIVCDKKELVNIKKRFDLVGATYAGHLHEAKKIIDDKTHEIEKLHLKMESMEKEHRIQIMEIKLRYHKKLSHLKKKFKQLC